MAHRRGRALRWYKLRAAIDEIAKSVMIEKDADSPFMTGSLQIGLYDDLPGLNDA